MSLRPFNGYPDSWGSKKVTLFPHAGPASYTQVTNGGPPVTGGDVVQAVEGGLKNLDFLSDGVSDDGRFRVEAIPVTSSVTGINSSSLSGIPATTYRLRWIATFTGAFGGQAQTANTEVVAATNLSTVTVRLQGFGVSS
jgi:hypothetical protein